MLVSVSYTHYNKFNYFYKTLFMTLYYQTYVSIYDINVYIICITMMLIVCTI